MNTKSGFLIAILLAATLLPTVLFASGPKSKGKKSSSGYLRHALPVQLAFDIDALPADRMMLVTKAPKVNATLPLVTVPSIPLGAGAEENKTAGSLIPLEPVVTVDPPPLPSDEPSLSVPAPDPLDAPAVLLPQGGAGITTDQVIQLLEIQAKSSSPSGLRHHVVVPFQMPHSQTPSAGVYKSKTQTRYIKRIK